MLSLPLLKLREETRVRHNRHLRNIRDLEHLLNDVVQ